MISLNPKDLLARAGAPISIAAQGGAFIGGKRIKRAEGTFLSGQLWVEYRIPEMLKHPFPIVMIHGGGGQGADYLTKPDGGEGWASTFLRSGYAVYVVDRPGFGRSPLHPELNGEITLPISYELAEKRFTGPSHHNGWPQAALHTQWPGSGRLGDEALDQFAASSGPSPASLRDTHEQPREALVELMKSIGPSYLITHSAGAPSGWLLANDIPDLVKAIIAVEPLGPPFMEHPNGKLEYGITAAPLKFSPPLSKEETLQSAEQAAPDKATLGCKIQAEPARQLPSLANIPVIVITAEASWMAQTGHGVVDFLVQAGVSASHLRLADHGIHGNGHMVMLEKNSDQIAKLIEEWIEKLDPED